MSFEELFKPCQGAVFRYCRYKLPTLEDAEDVYSEVCLEAFRNFSGLKHPERFRQWIIGIAKNRCAQWYRDNIAFQSVSLDEVSDTVPELQTPAFDEVYSALGRLKSDEREILSLYYFEELPQLEIAQLLGIPPGTVKSRLHRARENFRRYYPEKTKGENQMNRLPEIMPEYKIEKLPLKPFEVDWEEIMGWMIVPRVGEKLSWGLYDMPARTRTEWTEIEVVGKAEVHGIQGTEAIAVQHDAENYFRTGSIKECEWRFIHQLTHTHCRTLAETHIDADGVRRCHTFLDGEEFEENWGVGPGNCGHEIHLKRKGIIERDGNIVTREQKPLSMSMDIVGRYKVTIGGREYDTVCFMDLEAFDDSIVTEQYLDRNGRTVLWRRFNKDDWGFKHYCKLWTQMLPENERLQVNSNNYVHWYDCISDYISQ